MYLRVFCIFIAFQNNDIKNAVDTEFKVFKLLQNASINCCRAYALDRKKGSGTKEAYIIMELCPGGDLMTYLKKAKEEHRRLSENEALLIMLDIAQGVKLMHDVLFYIYFSKIHQLHIEILNQKIVYKINGVIGN